MLSWLSQKSDKCGISNLFDDFEDGIQFMECMTLGSAASWRAKHGQVLPETPNRCQVVAEISEFMRGHQLVVPYVHVDTFQVGDRSDALEMCK